MTGIADGLSSLFLKLLNMSYTASLVIVAVLLVRLLLGRAPKIFSYCLWAVVLFRLLCPISFESSASPLPSAQLIDPATIAQQRPVVTSGIEAIDRPINGYLTSSYFEGVTQPVGHSRQLAASLAGIWLAGALALAGKSGYELHRLHRRLRNARHLDGPVWLADNIGTAFVLGVRRPRIYLPGGISTTERRYILLHEETHLRRLDHLWKLLGFGALVLHWFNPLVWLAFRLGVQDMEMSCDEAVLKKLGPEIRPDYSASLLRLAANSPNPASALAFGEGGVKQRIKNVLSWRRPALWVSLAALVGVALCIGWLAANPKQTPLSGAEWDELIRQQAGDYMEQRIAESSLAVSESQLTDLRRLGDFPDWPGVDYQVQIWELGYRLRPTDPGNIPLIDYTMDQEGWIDWSYGLCRHLLVFVSYPGSAARPRLLGELNPLDCDSENLPSLENAARALLEQLGMATPETFPGEHVVAQFTLSDGETCQLLLSQPATKGEQGIWCVERWAQGNGNLYYVRPADESAQTLTLEEYYAGLQQDCDQGHQPWRLNPEETAIDFIRNELGQWQVNMADLQILRPAALEDFARLPESHYYAYIGEFNPADITGRGTLHFNAERVELRENQGFVEIHRTGYPQYFEADDATRYIYQEMESSDPTAFAAYLAGIAPENRPLFSITTHEGVVTDIAEVGDIMKLELP